MMRWLATGKPGIRVALGAAACAAVAFISPEVAWTDEAPACEPVVSAGQSDTKLLHAGKLLTVPGRKPQETQTIVVRGGEIVEVIAGYRCPQDLGLEAAAVFDLSRRFVLPGLIDSHVHITSTPSPTFLLDRVTMSDAHRAIWGAANARDTLLAGFTTVRNLAAFRGDSFDADFALRDGIEAGKVPGPRILAAGQGIGSTASQGDFLGYRYEVMDLFAPRSTCSGAAACREAVRYQVKRGADFIKMVATGWATGPAQAGDQQHMFPDEMEAVVATARLFGRKVTAHATGVEGVKAALRAGVDSIEHGMVLDDEAIALFRESGAYLVPTLLVTERFIAQEEGAMAAEEGGRVPGSARPAEAGEAQSLRAVAERMYDSHRRAHRAGVRFAFGTDSAITPHGDNAREFAMLVERVGMTPMEAIVTATVNAADHIGLSDTLGTLEPGKAADLIAVDGDPLRDVTELERVSFVMRAGRVYRHER